MNKKMFFLNIPLLWALFIVSDLQCMMTVFRGGSTSNPSSLSKVCNRMIQNVATQQVVPSANRFSVIKSKTILADDKKIDAMFPLFKSLITQTSEPIQLNANKEIASCLKMFLSIMPAGNSAEINYFLQNLVKMKITGKKGEKYLLVNDKKFKTDILKKDKQIETLHFTIKQNKEKFFVEIGCLKNKNIELIEKHKELEENFKDQQKENRKLRSDVEYKIGRQKEILQLVLLLTTEGYKITTELKEVSYTLKEKNQHIDVQELVIDQKNGEIDSLKNENRKLMTLKKELEENLEDREEDNKKIRSELEHQRNDLQKKNEKLELQEAVIDKQSAEIERLCRLLENTQREKNTEIEEKNSSLGEANDVFYTTLEETDKTLKVKRMQWASCAAALALLINLRWLYINNMIIKISSL